MHILLEWGIRPGSSSTASITSSGGSKPKTCSNEFTWMVPNLWTHQVLPLLCLWLWAPFSRILHVIEVQLVHFNISLLTLLEIVFSINVVCHFMHFPMTDHWTIVKCIFCCLKDISAGLPLVKHILGLHLHWSSSSQLHAYTDVDWAGCLYDRCSNVIFVFILAPISSLEALRNNTPSLDLPQSLNTKALLILLLSSFGYVNSFTTFGYPSPLVL